MCAPEGDDEGVTEEFVEGVAEPTVGVLSVPPGPSPLPLPVRGVWVGLGVGVCAGAPLPFPAPLWLPLFE